MYPYMAGQGSSTSSIWSGLVWSALVCPITNRFVRCLLPERPTSKIHTDAPRLYPNPNHRTPPAVRGSQLLTPADGLGATYNYVIPPQPSSHVLAKTPITLLDSWTLENTTLVYNFCATPVSLIYGINQDTAAYFFPALTRTLSPITA